MRAPRANKLLGLFQKLNHLGQLLFRLFYAATSSKVTVGFSRLNIRARLLLKAIAWFPLLCAWRKDDQKKDTDQNQWQHIAQNAQPVGQGRQPRHLNLDLGQGFVSTSRLSRSRSGLVFSSVCDMAVLSSVRSNLHVGAIDHNARDLALHDLPGERCVRYRLPEGGLRKLVVDKNTYKAINTT